MSPSTRQGRYAVEATLEQPLVSSPGTANLIAGLLGICLLVPVGFLLTTNFLWSYVEPYAGGMVTPERWKVCLTALLTISAMQSVASTALKLGLLNHAHFSIRFLVNWFRLLLGGCTVLMALITFAPVLYGIMLSMASHAPAGLPLPTGRLG